MIFILTATNVAIVLMGLLIGSGLSRIARELEANRIIMNEANEILKKNNVHPNAHIVGFEK